MIIIPESVWPESHAQPDGQRRYMSRGSPTMNVTPTRTSVIRRAFSRVFSDMAFSFRRCRTGSSALRLQSLHVGSRQRLASDGPLAARDFEHADPSDAPHSFSLDADHGLGHLFDHAALLRVIEDSLDELNVD